MIFFKRLFALGGGVVFKSAPTFFSRIAVSSSPSTVIHLKRSHKLIKARNEQR